MENKKNQEVVLQTPSRVFPEGFRKIKEPFQVPKLVGRAASIQTDRSCSKFLCSAMYITSMMVMFWSMASPLCQGLMSELYLKLFIPIISTILYRRKLRHREVMFNHKWLTRGHSELGSWATSLHYCLNNGGIIKDTFYKVE